MPRQSPVPAADIYELTVAVPQAIAWHVAEALEQAEPAPAATGLTELDSGSWLVWAHYDAPPSRQAVAALVGAAVGMPVDPAQVSLEPLPHVDWVARSQAMLPPVRAGRFIVHGSHDRAAFGSAAFAIEIDAGRAFGTAHHASTRGCLLALDDLLKRHRFARVLDMGTGSGVLAIAVARMQGSPVLASDIDPIAVATARDNARLNGVAGLVQVVEAAGLGDPALRAAQPFDLVIANILARPLAALAPALAQAVRNGGLVVLSGLTRDQARWVAGHYRMSGFALLRRVVLGDWATLVLRKEEVLRKEGFRRRRPA